MVSTPGFYNPQHGVQNPRHVLYYLTWDDKKKYLIMILNLSIFLQNLILRFKKKKKKKEKKKWNERPTKKALVQIRCMKLNM